MQTYLVLELYVMNVTAPTFFDAQSFGAARLEPTWKTHRAHVRNVKKRVAASAGD